MDQPPAICVITLLVPFGRRRLRAALQEDYGSSVFGVLLSQGMLSGSGLAWQARRDCASTTASTPHGGAHGGALRCLAIATNVDAARSETRFAAGEAYIGYGAIAPE